MPQSCQSPPKKFRFGLFEADAARSILTRNGTQVKIQEQPFRALLTLLEKAGQIVTREELRQRIWPDGTFVDFEGSLNVIFKRLRGALDDDPDNPRFIETIPRKGYRFIAPVTGDGSEKSLLFESSAQSEPISPLAPTLDLEAKRHQPLLPSRPWTRRWRYAALAGFTLIALLIVIGLIRFWGGEQKSQANEVEATRPKSVAVIPFSNSGAGPTFDYLRYAIASDVVNDLTYVRSISVRPLTSTTQYGEHPVGVATAGRELKVEYAISGDLASERGKLKVMAELTRVADDRVIWRDRVSADPNELVRLHDDLSLKLQNGVVAVLGSAQTVGEIPVPHSQRAYELYLRSVAIPRDGGPNKFAIAGLQASVAEDPNYAPAWKELAWRYYLDAQSGTGGEKSYKKSEEASARAATLDPNGIVNWARIQAEHGDLEGAYDVARAQLLRRPDASQAHFEMAYVYRYAGLLDQAARECDAALALDPGQPGFRSCAKVFMYRGDYKRAAVFADLDGNSGWSALQRMDFALRQGQEAEALVLATIAAEGGYRDSEIIQARLRNEAPAIINSIAEKEEVYAAGESDPEDKYEAAAVLSYAGQTDRAMRVLRSAIDRNYCAVSMLESDPILAPLRARTDFQELKNEATACQQNFLAHTEALASGTSSHPQ
jgi:DNA-binding winged helix-turn-helix (wHTH) protein/TolB-like protein